MITKQYDELIRQAVKGDRQAMDELFALAEAQMANEHSQDAALLFREAAIAFRISASRNLTHAMEAEGQGQWMVTVRDTYAKWIKQNPNGFRPIPRALPGITHDFIARIVLDQLPNEKEFLDVLDLLEQALSRLGMKFYSPGGSIQRRALQLLGEVFGLTPVSGYLRSNEVRICLDQIADAVEAKFIQGAPNGH